MKKILIVEDEVSSREGIRNLFDASLLPLQIETAADGYDGYEKALSFQPDIIISDIKMPRWTGITMVENLRKKDLQSRIIFLTGFAEFEYAQKAIQFGASDYVLKPVVPSDLIQKVSHLLEELEQQNTDSIQTDTDSKLYLLSEDDLSDFQKKLFIHNYTDYFLSVVYMEDETHLPPEIKEILRKAPNAHVVTLADRHYRGIILGFSNHLVQHSMISRLSTLMEKHANLTCIYTMKKHTSDLDWLSQFQLLARSICWSITYGSTFFAYNEEMTKDIATSPDLTFYKKELQRLYAAKEYAACLEFIQNHLYQMQRKQCPPSQILMAVTSSIRNVFSEKQYLQALNRITKAQTMHEITSCLNWYFEIGITPAADTHYSRLVQGAIHFIQESYSEPISLNTAADQLSITPQYLSKIFTQETSQTFVDYLTQFRMEKAKSMLANTNLQINVISSKVGYMDPKYFCTIFKKQTGVTPNQYRKANAGGNGM